MSYPMALAKQAKFDYISRQEALKVAYLQKATKASKDVALEINSYEYGDCDIHVSFHSSLDWYFGNGEITSEQLDIRLQAAEFLTWGIGIRSNFVGLDDNYKAETYYITNPSTRYLGYMSPWDNLIYGTYAPQQEQQGLFENVLNIFGIWFSGTSIGPQRGNQVPLSEVVFKKLLNSGLYGKNLTQTDFNRIKSDTELRNNYFNYTNWHARVGDGEVLNLVDGDISNEYAETRDFLLSASEPYGHTIESLMDRFNDGRLYGPRLLKALELIGHSTHRNPQNFEFYTGNVSSDMIGFQEFPRDD